MSEAEIIARWSRPNLIRQHGLNKLDHMTWEQSEVYDGLERRESCLLDLMEVRSLTPEEERELGALGRRMDDLQKIARAQRRPATAAA